uniref:Uncharacterized protein n=1 Tax=Panagrolaimus sp. ES5 TaxID=591445 RepID=A0AC34FVD4_9BILA
MMGGGGCNCPPPPSCAPPPVCAAPAPTSGCGGGSDYQSFPAQQPQFYRPQPPQPFYPNNGGPFIGSPGGNGGGGQYVQAQQQVLPSLQLGQGAPPAPAAPPGFQPQPNYNQAPPPPPPPPPPVRPAPSPYNQHGEESQSTLFSEYDEKISVEPAERTYNSATPPTSSFIDTDAKSASHTVQSQVEVMPSSNKEETSYNDKVFIFL